MWIGTILIFFSIISLRGFFLKNEWRAPLLELSRELETNPAVKKIQAGFRRRATLLVFFFLFLYAAGSFEILNSTVIEDFKAIAILMLGIIALWLLKGAYELIRAFNSRKTWLLNYLFSPYLFAWKRDHLAQYSDYEIASAILKLCDLKPKTPLSEDIDLKSFLIALQKHVRPEREHASYPNTLDDNIKQAEKMSQI